MKENTAEFFTRINLSSVRKALLPDRGECYLNSWQKRMMDIMGIIVATPFLIVPLLAGMMAVKLEDMGNIFYTQQRIGKDGKYFGIFKLRTMKPVAEMEDKPFTFPNIVDESRLTKIGKVLRRWCINELPQIANIARGEMSIIGIRPLPPDQFELYRGLDNISDLSEKWVKAYYLSKSGWTSLTSVKGRALLDQDATSVRRRMRYEIFYASHASFGLDCLILKEGVNAFFSGRGAN